ncbi:hypothetical protein B0H10DRAFT_1963776 [Mycena sp. CBHHK59/15]|nr:hypothetical protein B0H10DRAFT_1963776 [Mycena sp. CBHHK59/15]
MYKSMDNKSGQSLQGADRSGCTFLGAMGSSINQTLPEALGTTLLSGDFVVIPSEDLVEYIGTTSSYTTMILASDQPSPNLEKKMLSQIRRARKGSQSPYNYRGPQITADDQHKIIVLYHLLIQLLLGLTKASDCDTSEEMLKYLNNTTIMFSGKSTIQMIQTPPSNSAHQQTTINVDIRVNDFFLSPPLSPFRSAAALLTKVSTSSMDLLADGHTSYLISPIPSPVPRPKTRRPTYLSVKLFVPHLPNGPDSSTLFLYMYEPDQALVKKTSRPRPQHPAHNILVAHCLVGLSPLKLDHPKQQDDQDDHENCPVPLFF